MFARTWLIGTTSLWIAGLLTAYVLVYFLSLNVPGFLRPAYLDR